LLLYVLIELFVVDFVAFLEFTVVREILLDCIVCQMHTPIAYFECVFGRRRSDVALAVPIAFHPAMSTVEHHIVPQIKLPLFVKQRPLYVLLQDVSFQGAVGVLLLPLEYGFDLVEFQADDDAVSSVGVLPWLHNPSVVLIDAVFVVFGSFVQSIEMLQKFQILLIF